MTPYILSWLQTHVLPLVNPNWHVLEIGSLNVNGEARSVFTNAVASWTGVDRQNGPGVDYVGTVQQACSQQALPQRKFNMVVACETLEHDPRAHVTLSWLRVLLSDGGLLLITTPGYGFPYHAYPKDYYRFSEDAYREVFFAGMDIIRLETIIGDNLPTICGVARQRS